VRTPLTILLIALPLAAACTSPMEADIPTDREAESRDLDGLYEYNEEATRFFLVNAKVHFVPEDASPPRRRQRIPSNSFGIPTTSTSSKPSTWTTKMGQSLW